MCSQLPCKTYCEGQGKTCLRAQDADGGNCNLYDGHNRQTMLENGCLQSWGDQVCACG